MSKVLEDIETIDAELIRRVEAADSVEKLDQIEAHALDPNGAYRAALDNSADLEASERTAVQHAIAAVQSSLQTKVDVRRETL